MIIEYLNETFGFNIKDWKNFEWFIWGEEAVRHYLVEDSF